MTSPAAPTSPILGAGTSKQLWSNVAPVDAISTYVRRSTVLSDIPPLHISLGPMQQRFVYVLA